MFIDLEIQEQGEWFYFFSSHIDETTGDVIYEEPVNDARVKIRNMAPFVEAKVADKKREYQYVMNKKTRQMERVGFYPDQNYSAIQKEREETWDYVIQGIEGFKDKKTGKEITCTKDNKIKLMKIPVFDRFLARCLQLLSESGVAEQEATNLPAGSSGKTPPLDSE